MVATQDPAEIAEAFNEFLPDSVAKIAQRFPVPAANHASMDVTKFSLSALSSPSGKSWDAKFN